MLVAEDGLELMQDDTGGSDGLFSVEKVADGCYLRLHETGPKHDAQVALPHLALLLMRQHLLPQEVKQQENSHLIWLGQFLDGLYHHKTVVRIVIASHKHFESVIGDDWHSEIGEKSFDCVLMVDKLLAMTCGLVSVCR